MILHDDRRVLLSLFLITRLEIPALLLNYNAVALLLRLNLDVGGFHLYCRCIERSQVVAVRVAR